MRSRKKTFRVGSSTDVGTRYREAGDTSEYRMEDASAQWASSNGVLVAVADGHGSYQMEDGRWEGGRKAADAALTGVGAQKHASIQSMFASAAREVDSIEWSSPTQRMPDGSTQVFDGKRWTTCVSGTTLCVVQANAALCTVAHIGDTRAVIVKDGAAFVGEEHSSKTPAEVAAMRAAGARKMKNHFDVRIGRYEYSVQLSRCLGHPGNAMIGRELELNVVEGPWRAIVVATDGVWDHVGLSEVESIVEVSTSPQQAADSLISAARKNAEARSVKSRDNATAVVVMQEEQQACLCAVM